MSTDPFTIRIFVPDGDPEGIRIIDRMNWTEQATSGRIREFHPTAGISEKSGIEPTFVFRWFASMLADTEQTTHAIRIEDVIEPGVELFNR